MQSNQDIFKIITSAGQGHLVDHYHSLKDQNLRKQYLEQIKSIDYPLINKLYNEVYKANAAQSENKYDAITDVVESNQIEKNKKQYLDIGLEAIRKGQVAVLLMSGGQGTRLGFDHPKGMYKIGLQSGVSLFQFFAKRLQTLNQLAKAVVPIAWYIMTSEINDQEIRDFFSSNNYFGYAAKSIRFFPQGALPALNYDGKIIIQSQGKVSLAPAGNGAIYYQLNKHKMIQDMKARNVKYVNIGAIDNILLKLGDPVALGYMIKNNRDIVSKVISKRNWEQKVGCHIMNNGKPKVMEYSEMTEDLKKMLDNEGKLKYRHSFIAIYFMTVDLIYDITNNPETMAKLNAKYHVAQKKIAHYDEQTKQITKPTKNNGIKFELFCFDCFDISKAFGLFEVKRQQQFAPVKNATGEDSPQSARLLISNLHYNWLRNAGLKFKEEPNAQDKQCEVDISLTYDGQGLQNRVKEVANQPVNLPFYLRGKL